jgi:HNH endonuclease
MSYVFDLKQSCGGYAYFSTFTMGDHGKSIYEIRTPSLVVPELFQSALAEIGQTCCYITSAAEYNEWLHLHGWALVSTEFARANMPQWLKRHQCLKSALGSYIDISIASPSTLKRTLRGRQKMRIHDRDGNHCLRCRSIEKLTLQHVQPFSHGGETNSSNLVTLCEKCNQDLKNEIDTELYQLAGLRSGVEPSLLKASPMNQMAFMRAVYFSHNIMHTRCELW